MKVLLLEPFFTGSHQSWAEGYQRHSSLQVELLTLRGKHWKWRMHGGAVSLANQFIARKLNPDVILASSMMDLNLFLSLTRHKTHSTAVVLYFHENQFFYPKSEQDTDLKQARDNHHAFINFTSALCADKVIFNSAFNRSTFLNGSRELLKRLPRPSLFEEVKKIEAKMLVLPVGLELPEVHRQKRSGVPVILWNHRWEEDKNPELFFTGLGALRENQLSFKLIVLGAQAGEGSDFVRWRETYKDETLHWGFAESKAVYWRLLAEAELLPVTSKQEFFGISVLEALHAGVSPLLPNRLSYPEFFTELEFSEFSYASDEEFVSRLIDRVKNNHFPTYAHVAKPFHWEKVAPAYDELLVNLPENNTSVVSGRG